MRDEINIPPEPTGSAAVIVVFDDTVYRWSRTGGPDIESNRNRVIVSALLQAAMDDIDLKQRARA
jgi:hypothetical protein